MSLPQRRLSGVPQSLWVLAVVILALVPKTESITAAEKTTVKRGLQTGKEILGLIAEHKFHETLTKVAKGASGFIGVLGPFAGLIMSFVPSDTAELNLIKEFMIQIDTHFDRVDSRFDDVQRLIKWTETAVQFGEIESSLNALKEEYRHYYTSSAPASNKSALFKSSYDSNYKLAGTRLYLALVTQKGTFNENLGQAVMRYTKNDRKKTEVFLLRTLEMIFEAIRLEAGYYNMSGFVEIAESRKEDWTNKTEKIRLKMDQIDEAVKNKYHAQSLEDILEYASGNSGMNNEQFSSGLFTLLEKKYYWRVWFVLIYDPITGSDVNRMDVCGGHIRLRQNGRSIVVASKDKTQQKMNLNDAEEELQKFSLKNVPSMFGPMPFVFYGQTRISKPRNAEEYFNKADKTRSCSFAVVDKNANVFYKSSENRVAYHDTKYFKLFMFG